MATLYGWTGKILKVDLTSCETTTIDTAEYLPHYVGGMGVAARIAWETLRPGVDAFDPDNPLFLMVGPLTGTLASGAGRILVAGISPQLDPSVFSRSSMGGHWGAELKYAGYDGIVVVGKAEKPVYLWIHDGEVEICDAAELWGTGTCNTTAVLRGRYGQKTRIAAIGQAGENRSRIACIQSETGNAAGQGGFGGLMGSKKLKAIAVRGTQGVRVADPPRLMDLCLHASREGAAPEVPGAPRGDWIRRMAAGVQLRPRKCGFCATICHDQLMMGVPGEVSPQTHNVVWQCWGYMTSLRAHAEARAITADYGINGWEIVYGLIPWLQMCRQHGLIDRVNGVEIPVPEKEIYNLQDTVPVPGEFLMPLLHSVARRDGELGDILAEGTCRAAKVLFGGQGLELVDRIYPRRCGETNHWNSHWGTGGSGYWPFWLVPVLQWCIDSRDPASDSTHQFTEHVLRYIPIHGPNRGPLSFEEARHVCQAVYGNAEVCNPELAYDPPETKVVPAIFHHNRGMLVESLVLCDRENTRVFSMQTEDHVADTALMSKLFSAVTGFETCEQEMDRAGERVFNLLRAIDVRFFGRDRDVDWSVAETLTQPAFADGVALDLEQFRPMLDTYYRLRGWNPANGYPTRAKLKELGLTDVAETLQGVSKLG